MKKPNLFILGAPKCGTTALAQWLSTHPQIFVSPSKEPHHFSEEHQLTPDIGRYESLFADAGSPHKWVCEASVWYLFSDTAVPNILRYSPDARFVVMVRNPLQMAPSMHEQHRFNGNELVADFGAALELSADRAMGRPIGVRAGYKPVSHLAYYRSCSLGWQIKRLFDIVPRDRVHVIFFDDLQQDPVATYGRLLEFLALRAVFPPRFEKVNGAKGRKSYALDRLILGIATIKRSLGIESRLGLLSLIRRWNLVHRPRREQTHEVMQRMATSFGPDLQLLGALLGRDVSRWLQV